VRLCGRGWLSHESECHSPACVTSLNTWGRPLSNFTAFNARWTMPFAESGGTSNSSCTATERRPLTATIRSPCSLADV
jgi:hypothetical protein